MIIEKKYFQLRFHSDMKFYFDLNTDFNGRGRYIKEISFRNGREGVEFLYTTKEGDAFNTGCYIDKMTIETRIRVYGLYNVTKRCLYIELKNGKYMEIFEMGDSGWLAIIEVYLRYLMFKGELTVDTTQSGIDGPERIDYFSLPNFNNRLGTRHYCRITLTSLYLVIDESYPNDNLDDIRVECIKSIDDINKLIKDNKENNLKELQKAPEHLKWLYQEFINENEMS